MVRIALYFSGRIKSYERHILQLQKLKEYYSIDVFLAINGELDEYHQQFIDLLNVKRYLFHNHKQIYEKAN